MSDGRPGFVEELMEQASQARRTPARPGVVVALAASAVAVFALAACTSPASRGQGTQLTGAPTSSAATTTSAASTPADAAAVITTSPHKRRISPVAPVTVGIEHGKLTSVTMVNPAGRQVSGELAADGSSWHNTEVLGYAKTYRINARGMSDAGERVSKVSKITTLTPDNMTMPYIEDIYGHYIADGNTYGVGMIVRVHFDESVNEKKAERTLHVTTTPATVGGWYWADSQNVYWRPQSFYAPGTQVTIAAKVYGHDVGSGLYGQADQSVSFTIGAKHLAVANAKTHKVKVYFDDQLVRTMPTSMGRGGKVPGRNGPIYLWTMPGYYTVINHENPATMSSDSYGLPADSPAGYAPEKVPWATKISVDGIYLHELDATVWAQGHQNVSHGCLNLNRANAKWYYQHSLIGDVVRVVHSGGPAITFNQGGQWSVPWSEWLAGSAL